LSLCQFASELGKGNIAKKHGKTSDLRGEFATLPNCQQGSSSVHFGKVPSQRKDRRIGLSPVRRCGRHLPKKTRTKRHPLRSHFRPNSCKRSRAEGGKWIVAPKPGPRCVALRVLTKFHTPSLVDGLPLRRPRILAAAPGVDRPAAGGVCLGVRLTVMDKSVCVSSPCVQGALYGSSRAVEQRTSVLYGDRCGDGMGGCNVSEEESLQRHLRGLESAVGVVSEARERVIWESSDGALSAMVARYCRLFQRCFP
jgi:hypothetical protein